MTSQCSLFIGSSTESIKYANALQKVLHLDVETKVWKYGVFLPGGYTLDSLVKVADGTDFAALFLTPDDKSKVRGHYLKTPRDNLVFELGLFVGRLKFERVFLITPHEGVDLPSDLQGVTCLQYRANRDDSDVLNAINPVATDVLDAIVRLGPRNDRESLSATPQGQIQDNALSAVAKLGAVASNLGLDVRIESRNGFYELIVSDETRLETSINVDLSGDGVATAIEAFGRRLGDVQGT